MSKHTKGQNKWNTIDISIYDLNTHRFLDFFFLVPPGPTSQLQGDPALNWGKRKERTHCIIHPPHRKRALQAPAKTVASSDYLQLAMTTQLARKQVSPWSVLSKARLVQVTHTASLQNGYSIAAVHIVNPTVLSEVCACISRVHLVFVWA